MESLIILGFVGAIAVAIMAAAILTGNDTAKKTKIRWKKDRTVECGDMKRCLMKN